MIWSRIIAIWAGVGILAFTSVAAAQQRESINPLARPLRDVGIVRDRVPEPLQSAARDPYSLPVRADGRLDCAAINTEIAALNGALGADLDTRIIRRQGVRDWIGGAIRGAIDVPYRGVVRRLTGAERRERELNNATQAGMVRRGFLRGLREANCSGPLPPLSIEALVPEPAMVMAQLDLNEAEVAETRVETMEPTPAPATRIVETTPVAIRDDGD